MLKKIISGGQTGVDQAALSFAIKNGFEHGGWCPLGRQSECGEIPEEFDGLKELTEVDILSAGYSLGLADQYRLRTRLNIQEADYTLIFVSSTRSAGTDLTIALCKGKPHQVVYPGSSPSPLPSGVEVLNVAGPRLSKDAEGPHRTTEVLRELLL